MKLTAKNTGIILFLFLTTMTGRLSGQVWQLVWSDEFDGNSLDESKWSFMIGDGTAYGLPSGWGNNELEYYLAENAVVGDSVLTITAKEELAGGKSYTSGRIRTLDKADWKYGRIEFRARMPVGQGLWPAIWMLPSENVYGGWAASGEIDIVEYLGDQPTRVYGTLHFGGQWPQNQHKGRSFLLDSGDFHSDFHEFAMEWEEGEIRWYVDGENYQTQGEGDWWSSGGEFPAPFDQRFHLLINLAVGGEWPGSPDETTEFPQELVIDYVRVYEKDVTGTGPVEMPSHRAGSLDQNHPNPFARSTTITYTLAEQEHVMLDVLDARGRIITTLTDGMKVPGSHRVIFDGTCLSPGLYFCRLRNGTGSKIKRMVLSSYAYETRE